MADAAVATTCAHRGAPLVPNQSPSPLRVHAGAHPCKRNTSASNRCACSRKPRGGGIACAG
eukprot:8135142-Alexandrium_andersonii.AAC.1